MESNAVHLSADRAAQPHLIGCQTSAIYRPRRGLLQADVSIPFSSVVLGLPGLRSAIELRARGGVHHHHPSAAASLAVDRAAVVRSRSLEIFEALGLAEKFVNRGRRSLRRRFL